MGRTQLVPCPCGLPHQYQNCCGRFIEQQQEAENAEQLMRSRYSAYVLKNECYLLKTWHPSTRPDKLSLLTETPCKWLGLTVHEHISIDAHHATVRFTARYKINGRAHTQHENSQFTFENQKWFYVDGVVK